MNNENRWRQRFENFEKSFQVFQRRMDALEKHPESEGCKIALVKSFELLIELSWNTLKDYMENHGKDPGVFPKNIIRRAFEAELISADVVWMQAIKIRNKSVHIYREDILKEVQDFIQKSFYPVVRDLYFELKKEL